MSGDKMQPAAELVDAIFVAMDESRASVRGGTRRAAKAVENLFRRCYPGEEWTVSGLGVEAYSGGHVVLFRPFQVDLSISFAASVKKAGGRRSITGRVAPTPLGALADLYRVTRSRAGADHDLREAESDVRELIAFLENAETEGLPPGPLTPSDSYVPWEQKHPSPISRAVVEEVLARTSIVDLVGQTVTLVVNGRNYVGSCPFHAGEAPSFTVLPHKGIYHCFGCGEGGDAVSWLRKTRGSSFIEAVKELAASTGIVIEERP